MESDGETLEEMIEPEGSLSSFSSSVVSHICGSLGPIFIEFEVVEESDSEALGEASISLFSLPMVFRIGSSSGTLSFRPVVDSDTGEVPPLAVPEPEIFLSLVQVSEIGSSSDMPEKVKYLRCYSPKT